MLRSAMVTTHQKCFSSCSVALVLHALHVPKTLHLTPYTIHPTPYTLHPTPYTLHPAPYTPHPTPYTLHPAPCTLHPAPCTLHPTPLNLEPEQAVEAVAENVRAEDAALKGERDNAFQGYIAHKKQQLPRTLHYDYAYGPMVVIGVWLFILSEVPS